MKTWSYSANSLSPYKYGTVHVVDMPWYLLFAEWFADNAHSCIPEIPFPDFPKRVWKDSDGEKYSPKEWYGDTGQWWCSHVCNPLGGWVYRHPKRKEYSIEVGYDKLKEIFGERDPKFFERQDKDAKDYDYEEKQNVQK